MQMDATEVRERQRQDWDTASRGWHDWQEQMQRDTRRVSERLVELAGIKPGDRVLDVAAGLGEPSLTAAKVVGPDGSVVATDISKQMLVKGRERADAAGVENIEFVESDAASLDVPPPPPGTPGPLSRPTPEAIAAILEGGGFSDVDVEELELDFEYESAEEFTRFIREIAPPVSNLLASHPPEVQDETWAAITEAVRAHAGDDGKVRMKNLVLVAAGRA